MDEIKTKIGTPVHVGLPYDQAVQRATEALKAEGFGVLTEIDVKATMRKKLDADFRRYVILGACNPPLALRALNADLDVGLLLPCNVVVYEVDDSTSVINVVDPVSMLGVLPTPGLEPIAEEAKARLERVADALRE